LSHPEFEDRFVYKKNFADNNTDPDDDEIDSHGSGVAGIAAAKGNNGKFMAGMDWNCKIMPLKVLNDQGEGSSFAACNAVSYALEAGAKIVNYSGGGWYNSWTNSSIIEEWQKVAQKCASSDALLICSAGNDNRDVEGTFSTHYPGGGLKDYANVITVAAINESGDLTSGTNYGNAVTIAAPGESVTTVLKDIAPGEPLIEHTGTSFAAPFVTGLASLIWSIDPTLTAEEVKTCIVSGADSISQVKNVGKKLNAWNSILLALQYKGNGVIAVKSDPDGAAISIDGTSTGRTTSSESTYFEAAEGDHTVSVSKSGYTASSEVVTVGKGAVTNCVITLGTIAEYSLTVHVTPEGAGTVEPWGGTFVDGTSVVLTAEAYSGYQFSSWEGDASGTSETTIVLINGNKNVTAYFIGHYTDNGNGTITDNITGLMWVQDPSVIGSVWGTGEGYPSKMTWYNATIECDALDHFGHDDWRLPTIDELTTITAEGSAPTIDPIFTNTKSSAYWSSTIDPDQTTSAWVVTFINGSVFNYEKTFTTYVRPVRGSP
jgi:hypothetical protein